MTRARGIVIGIAVLAVAPTLILLDIVLSALVVLVVGVQFPSEGGRDFSTEQFSDERFASY